MGWSPKNQCGAGHYKQGTVYNECCNWVLVKHQWSHCNTVNLNFIGFVVVSLYLFSFCSWVRALCTRSLYLNLCNNVLKYFKSPQGSENFFFPFKCMFTHFSTLRNTILEDSVPEHSTLTPLSSRNTPKRGELPQFSFKSNFRWRGEGFGLSWIQALLLVTT